jgi:N-acetylmuramoyl-L-alanine amidase
MRPLYIVTAIIYLFLTVNFSSLYAENPVKIVVIDAGHGGNDPGAIGISGVKEKDITLALALKLGALIEKNTNIKVVYTRKTDVAVDLRKRSQIANNNHADYFISIHCNSVEKNSTVSGAETFVMGLSKSESNLAVAQKENAAILNEQDHEDNYGGFDPTSPEAYIIFSIFQNIYREQSIKLAAAIQLELTTLCKRQDRGVKEAVFLVLWHSAMPNVLVEAGFLSNREEETYLASEKGQAELSLALYNGFAKTARLEPLKKPDFSNLADTIPSNVRVSSSIVYRVQFLTAPKEYKKTDPELKNLSDIRIEKIGNVYKYTAGNYATHAEARYLLTTAKKVGFTDAFIVTAKSDVPIIPPKNEIKESDKKIEKIDSIFVSNTVKKSNVVYKIQFLLSSQEYKKTDAKFQNLPDIEIEKVGNSYKYRSGRCSTYEEAKNLLEKVKQAGFSDAFMLAYKKDGTKITIQEAKELENKK